MRQAIKITALIGEQFLAAEIAYSEQEGTNRQTPLFEKLPDTLTHANITFKISHLKNFSIWRMSRYILWMYKFSLLTEAAVYLRVECLPD